MTNPIGVHFIFTHKSQAQYDFIQAMQPGILKIVGSSTPDVQEIVDSYAAAPNAILYLRNHARSEQHDFLWRDPIGCAHQHVAEWHADLQERQRQANERGLVIPDRSQLRILGINEPVIELFARNEDMSNYDEWLAMVKTRAAMLDDYMVEFGQQANALGYPAGLGNISSGQPANLRPGLFATFDWFPKTRRFLESTRGKNAYTCHEYWRAETGPEGQADWHAWRFTHLELDADIDVLESGVDQQVTSEDPHGNRGWTGHMPAAAYVDQHRRYIARAWHDSRFRGETPFTLNGDKIWESFWVDYCMPEMLALSAELRASALPVKPATPPPVTTHLPQIGGGLASSAFAYVAAPAGANLRAAPSTDAPIQTAVPFGEAVRITGVSPEQGWVQVSYEGVNGWMSAPLLTLAQPQPLPAPIGETPTTPMPSNIIDPITALAFLQVESNNVSFQDGLLVIRFEVHVFKQQLARADAAAAGGGAGSTDTDALFDMHFRFTPGDYNAQYWRPSPNADWIHAHGPMDARHRLLAFARGLDDSAALQSTGMGAAQIMGSNYARIGYPTPQAMFGAFKHPRYGVNAQVLGFTSYVLSDPALAEALRQRDWLTAIRKYNGTGQEAYYRAQLTQALGEIRQAVGA